PCRGRRRGPRRRSRWCRRSRSVREPVRRGTAPSPCDLRCNGRRCRRLDSSSRSPSGSNLKANLGATLKRRPTWPPRDAVKVQRIGAENARLLRTTEERQIADRTWRIEIPMRIIRRVEKPALEVKRFKHRFQPLDRIRLFQRLGAKIEAANRIA